MKIKLILSFVLLSHCLYSQQTWSLRSENGDTIRFAKVIVLNSQNWTSSDHNGQFSMDLSEIGNDQFFNVSATGFIDTTFSYNDLKSSTTLYLQPQIFEMEEFVVTSKISKPYSVGDRELPLERSNKPSSDRSYTARYASFIQFKGNKTRLLSRLSFFLSENGDKDVEFVLRVMVSDEIGKPKEGRTYDPSQFRDINKDPMVFSTNSYGWSEIDLEDKEIAVQGKYNGAFLIFDVLQPINNMVIPFQDESNEKQYAGFYQPGGRIGIFDKKKDHFAVVVDYLME